MSNQRTRPAGVTILAILAVLAGVANIIRALEYFGVMPYAVGLDFFGVSPLGGILHLTATLVWFYIAYALWRLSPIGWIVVVVFSIINLVAEVISLLGGASLTFVLLPVIVNAIILIYSLSSGVRRAFGR
jgi:hypothetical protein